MTPQIYVKLTSQIARQTTEAEALEAQALALQPAIDSAQTLLDSCQVAVDSAQAALTEAQAIEGADTTEQQAELTAAQATLETAKTDLAKAKAPQDIASAHALQIRSAIAQCQGELDAGGLVMTEAEIEAVRSANIVPKAITKRQGRAQLKAESLLTPVENYMASLPKDNITRMAYEDASEWRRADPNVIGMMAMLGKKDADADAFFTAAAML